MSKSTKYTVTSVNAEGVRTEVGTKSKKATAVELARTTRNEQLVAVEVTTGTGTVVFTQDAPKKIKMSPRYSRVQALPEGVELDESVAHLRPAYVRPRRNGAILHDPEAEKDKQYVVVDLTTGKPLKQRFPLTRAAGAYLNDGVGKRRKELAELRAAKAQGGEQSTPAPEPETADA